MGFGLLAKDVSENQALGVTVVGSAHTPPPPRRGGPAKRNVSSTLTLFSGLLELEAEAMSNHPSCTVANY